MGKSTSGPDWTDIALYLSEMEEQLGCELTLLLTPGGGHGGLPLSCVLLASRKGIPPWEIGTGHSVTAHWPNRANKTLEGCVFALAVRIDGDWRRDSILQAVMEA